MRGSPLASLMTPVVWLCAMAAVVQSNNDAAAIPCRQTFVLCAAFLFMIILFGYENCDSMTE